MKFDKTKDEEHLTRILQDLYFDSISDRDAAIPKNHAQTFKWMFRQLP